MGLGLLIFKLRVSAVPGEPLGSAIRSWPTAIPSSQHEPQNISA